jgi:hypothetical protein
MNNDSKSDPRQTIQRNPDDGNSSNERMIGFKLGTLKNEISVPM